MLSLSPGATSLPSRPMTTPATSTPMISMAGPYPPGPGVPTPSRAALRHPLAQGAPQALLRLVDHPPQHRGRRPCGGALQRSREPVEDVRRRVPHSCAAGPVVLEVDGVASRHPPGRAGPDDPARLAQLVHDVRHLGGAAPGEADLGDVRRSLRPVAAHPSDRAGARVPLLDVLEVRQVAVDVGPGCRDRDLTHELDHGTRYPPRADRPTLPHP